ncbi:MAG: hypothetical protein HWN67_08960 [Candidatus Helarchaeota archaeon]|nr:hypothetical protein [Candidatus Helarchaeota archaeon]
MVNIRYVKNTIKIFNYLKGKSAKSLARISKSINLGMEEVKKVLSELIDANIVSKVKDWKKNTYNYYLTRVKYPLTIDEVFHEYIKRIRGYRENLDNYIIKLDKYIKEKGFSKLPTLKQMKINGQKEFIRDFFIYGGRKVLSKEMNIPLGESPIEFARKKGELGEDALLPSLIEWFEENGYYVESQKKMQKRGIMDLIIGRKPQKRHILIDITSTNSRSQIFTHFEKGYQDEPDLEELLIVVISDAFKKRDYEIMNIEAKKIFDSRIQIIEARDLENYLERFSKKNSFKLSINVKEYLQAIREVDYLYNGDKLNKIKEKYSKNK